MVKRSWKLLLASVILVFFMGVFYYSLNFEYSRSSIENFSKDILLSSETSSYGVYTFNVYLDKDNSIFEESYIIGEIYNNETNEAYNIYVEEESEAPEVYWLSDLKIKINDITLNIENEWYYKEKIYKD